MSNNLWWSFSCYTASAFGKESLIKSVNKVYNLPILHPILLKVFWYSLEYLALPSDSDYAITLWEHNILTCVFTKGHVHQFETAFHPTERITWCLYALFVINAEQIKLKCFHEIKPQLHNIACNLKKNVLAVSSLSTKKVQIRC